MIPTRSGAVLAAEPPLPEVALDFDDFLEADLAIGRVP
jgi:hypothetical protein